MYTEEQYQKTSILHPLIADTIDYAIEHLANGWGAVRQREVIEELQTSYGLQSHEAKAAVEIAVIGLMRADRR